MKAAVCFKAITDYPRMSQKDWEWDERFFVDTSFVRRIFNCFEESALEMALKLAETSRGGSDSLELTAITVDNQQGDIFLKQLMAVGYDHGVRIQCSKEPDLRFYPLAVAHLIAAYTRQQEQNLVILGMQGGEGDNGQTGFFVAENLGWPCIREVSRFVRDDESSDCLKVTSQVGGATLVQIVKLPMVLIIGHSLDSPFLRIPNLKQKLNAKKRQVTIVSDLVPGLSMGPDLGLDLGPNIEPELATGTSPGIVMENDKTLMDLQLPLVSQPCAFIKGENAREQALHLYDQYLKTRLPL